MDQEPLGYQHYLYDVNIEYNPGGNRTYTPGNRHNFKLKCLPYMVQDEFHKNFSASSNESSTSDRHLTTTTQDDESVISADSRLVDVTKTTCAFLGNSDYVPSNRFNRRRVTLELVSAKLSQSTTYNPSLVTLAEQPSNSPVLNRRRSDMSSRTSYSNNGHHNSIHSPNHTMSPTASPLSSKRFVNYTLLIKTAPGLDKQPAVIERRFSDFHLLYQGLVSTERHKVLLDRLITFPKKIYMGNFSLTNIAERSIEFARLLDLCMTRPSLLWSVPFMSFLLDKELREAHRLSLCGDPDDVQALIETAYYIQKKLYIRDSIKESNTSSLVSSDEMNTHDRYSPTSPLGPNVPSSSSSSNSGEISEAAAALPAAVVAAENSNCGSISNINTNNGDPSSKASSSPNMSISYGEEEIIDESSSLVIKTGLTPLNQRILVTFCMLFLTYYRAENYKDLRVAVQGFSQLISSQDYIDSILNTQHYMTLRACLLFLMNINHSNVIEVNQRLWLKRKLEDIDGAVADLDDHRKAGPMTSSNPSETQGSTMTRIKQLSNGATVGRNQRDDLTSLIRDRDFCSFQDTAR